MVELGSIKMRTERAEYVLDKLRPVRPLVIPVTPHANESLAGLVARSTYTNVLGVSRIILNEVGLRLPRPGSIGRDLGTLGGRLAEKIGCTHTEIAHRAHPYVDGAGRAEDVYWGGTALRRSDIHLNRRRVSPATLAGQDHHLSHWMLSLLPYCPLSFQRLIDRCATCERALGWIAARGIGTCEHCRRRLVHPDGEVLPEALRDGFSKFATLVSIQPNVRKAALAGYAPELAELSTNSLIDVIFTLGRAVTPTAKDTRRDRLLVTPPLVTAEIFSTGLKMVTCWPKGLRSLLAEHDGGGNETEQSVIRAIQVSVHNRNFEPNAAEIMRHALPELFTFGRKSLQSLKKPMMDPVEFRHRTGFSNAQWRTLHDSGSLGETHPTGSRRRSVRVTRAEAERLITLKNSSVFASKVEQLLGLPTYAVEQLACLGEIVHADHAGFRAISLETRITAASGAALIADLEKPENKDPPDGTTSILKLAARFCGAEKPWGAILADLRHGRTPYWLLPERNTDGKWRRPTIRRIVVRYDQFDSLVIPPFDPTMFANFPFETTLSQQDAIEILGITAPQMNKAVKDGTIVFRSVGKAIVTDRAQVSDLARIYVGASELGLKLGMLRNHLVVRRMKSTAQVRRHPFGWLRSDLARELPDLFGTSRSGDG